MAIEPVLARLAALRGTQADFDKLFEAADASRDARDPISYEKADAAFHRRVAVAARNPLLVTIFEAVLHVASDRSWRHGRETAHCINNQARYAAAHRKIAAAICERNPMSAEEAMRAHLAMVQQQLHRARLSTARNDLIEIMPRRRPLDPAARCCPKASELVWRAFNT